MLFEPWRRERVSAVRRERDAIIAAGFERVCEMPVRSVQRRPGSGDLDGTRSRVAGYRVRRRRAAVHGGQTTYSTGESVTTREQLSLPVAESIAGVDLEAELREYDPERGSAVVLGVGRFVVRPEISGDLAWQRTPIGVFVDAFAFKLEHPHQRTHGSHLEDCPKFAHHSMRRGMDELRRHIHV